MRLIRLPLDLLMARLEHPAELTLAFGAIESVAASVFH